MLQIGGIKSAQEAQDDKDSDIMDVLTTIEWGNLPFLCLYFLDASNLIAAGFDKVVQHFSREEGKDKGKMKW